MSPGRARAEGSRRRAAARPSSATRRMTEPICSCSSCAKMRRAVGEVAHLDRLRGGAEERLDRAAELGLHLDALGDGSRLGARQRAGEPALQDRLRALAESLPALLELLEEPEAGAALRHLPVGLLEPALGLAEFPGGLGDRLLGLGRRLVGAASCR